MNRCQYWGRRSNFNFPICLYFSLLCERSTQFLNNESNLMLTKQTSLKEVISLNTLPDIKNREYNRAKTPDLSAISAEQEAFAKTVHRKKRYHQ